MTTARAPFCRGIISVVQTPFDAATGGVDFDDLERLVEHAVDSGVDGFLAPVVASETAFLTDGEREAIVRRIASLAKGRVTFVVGASSPDPDVCIRFARLAEDAGADAWLAAVPASCYGDQDSVVPFFRSIVGATGLPLIIQDLEFNGPGLTMESIARLRDELPTLAGMKIETAPAGPKYTAVRELFGDGFFIAGGWAVPQMIEALDRGVDAMIPESSMIPVYHAIDAAYRSGDRATAVEIFRRLLPVLSFTNQELATSVAFFKRLLVRKGIFRREALRLPGFAWDSFNERIADELIEHYLTLEADVTG